MCKSAKQPNGDGVPRRSLHSAVKSLSIMDMLPQDPELLNIRSNTVPAIYVNPYSPRRTAAKQVKILTLREYPSTNLAQEDLKIRENESAASIYSADLETT